MFGLGVVRRKPSEDQVIVTAPNCVKLECEVEGGLAGWDYGAQPNYTHTLRYNTSFKLCFVNVTATFTGDSSEVTVCGSGNIILCDHPVLFMGCFAHNGTKREPEEALASNLIKIEARGELCSHLFMMLS